MDEEKPLSFVEQLRGSARGLYPPDYLQRERESWEDDERPVGKVEEGPPLTAEERAHHLAIAENAELSVITRLWALRKLTSR